MKKKLVIFLLVMVLLVPICIWGYLAIKGMIQKNSFFVVDSIHSTQSASFGSGLGERYYFAGDNTYYWNTSDYRPTDEIVATSGTWSLKDGKLILTELYNLCLEDGYIGKVFTPDGEEVDGLIDYEIVLKETKKQIVKNLEYVGVSEFSKDMMEEDEERAICYEYTMNGETWFSNALVEDMPWVEILKKKIVAKDEAIVSEDTQKASYQDLIVSIKNYLESESGEMPEELEVSELFALDIGNYGYTLTDLNNDGQQELLLYEIADGYWKNIVLDIYAIINNELTHIVSADEMCTYILCENNVIQEYCMEDEYTEYNAYYTLDLEGNFNLKEKVICKQELEEDIMVEKYLYVDSNENEKEISGQEAESICNKYVEREVYLMSIADIGE